MNAILFLVHHLKQVGSQWEGRKSIKMKLLIRLKFITLVIFFLLMTGCASTPKPPIAQVSLNVQPNINSYATNQIESNASPVVIRLYELNSPTRFNASDFLTVFHEHKTLLVDELVHSEEFILVPGKKQKFNRQLHLNTRYIGVVAAFRNLENSEWRDAIAIPANESAPEIFILVEGNKIKIGAKEACGFFCGLWSPKPPAGSLFEPIE